MALPNITDYTKNVAKSIVYTAADVVKTEMPTLSAYIDNDSNREISRSIYAGVKDYKGTITKAKAAIKGSKVFEVADSAVKGMIEDAKSGKFYNKERINALEEKTSEAMMGSFDDMDLDFNFDDGDSEITSGDKLVAASTQVAAYKAADMVVQTQIKSTDAIIKSQKASSNQQFIQNSQILGGLKEIAFVGAQSQGAMVNLNTIQENASRNSKMFYESTSKLLQESNAMVKEMLEMQRALYKNNQQQQQQKEKKKRIGYDDVVDYEGALDFRSYFDSIKANTKSTISTLSGGMSDLLTDMSPEMVKSLAGSPLQAISSMLLRAILPTATKGAAKNLDKTLSGVSSTMISRFNNMAKDSDNPIMQAIGQIFGLKTSPKTSLDPSKFTKGPVPFDGVARKTLVDVIPTYLRRIEAALTGQPEKIYDMGKGSWTDARRVKAEYDRMIKGSRSEANSDLVDEIRKVLNDKKSPKYSDKYSDDSFKESLETFLNTLYDRDGDFVYKSKEDAWKYGISSDDFAIIADMITNKKNRGMQRARFRHSNQVMSSKSSLSKRFENMEQYGDSPLFQLFNASTDYNNFKTPKYEDAPRAFAGALDLNNQTDKLGNNIFFYLRNMYNEIYTIRNYAGMGSGGAPMNAVAGSTGRAFSPPNTKSLSIPDNHKRTAKENYNAREEEQRRRYDRDIAKHVEKGGRVYDITDTRGNILKDRATVEEREALEQLEAANASHGWFNDLLYSQNTKLDEANRKRERDGEEKITGKKLLDRLKATKNLSEKFAVLQDQMNKFTSAPDKFATDLLEKADARIYSFFYGDETGEVDETTGKKVKGFMQLMNLRFNMTFSKINTFIDDKILSPIKKKLDVENVKQLMDKMGITEIWNNITTKLFGEKVDGKRQGGIFGETRDEIKKVFGGAKDYVFGSLKEVFSPITNKIKDAFANRPKTSKKLMSIDDITPEVLASFKPNMGPLNALFAAAPQEAITRLKKEISELLKSHNIAGSALILECSSEEDVAKASNKIMASIAKRKAKNTEAVKKKVNTKLTQLKMFFRKEEEKTKFDDRNKKETDQKAPKSKAVQEKLNEFKPGVGPSASEYDIIHNNKHKSFVDDVGKIVEITPARKGNLAIDAVEGFRIAEKPIMDFCKKLGLDVSKGDGAIVCTIIEKMLEADPDYSYSQPYKSLNKISMLDVHDALEEKGLTKIAYKVKQKMLNDYGNQDITLNTFIKSGKDTTTVSVGGNNIMNRAHDTLDKILSVIKSVVKDNAVVVEVKRKVKSSTNQSGSIGNIVSQVSGSRESETEGDSTGDSDGQLHSSAFGNIFKKNTSSALSKDEIYSRNGLLGKVPSTGVYDVKSGTTIYPTGKNKAIELANEQSAISRFLAKAGIVSNAEANSAPVKQHDGKKYTLQSDGKYHHYEKTPEGLVDHILEDGFIDQMYSTAKSGASSMMTGLGFKAPKEGGAAESVGKAMDVVKKYAPKMTAHGLLGAAIGLLSGNPLLGAAIGATSGYIQSSENAKTALFGKEIADADGNKSREGGIISKSTQDTFKKYMPNMGKYGTAGAVLGLVTPFGLMGGALIGSAIGWGVTDDKIKEALFGNLKDSASGLISKDLRDHVKKAAPNIAVGAIAGLLTGPFGLMGNLILGSGLGLASSTDGFKKFLFGEEVEDENGIKTRQGGLVGAIRTNVVDPLKDFAKTFKERTEEFVINDMINPLKEGIRPIIREMGLLTKGLIGFVPKMLNKLFESTFGRPLQDLIRDRIISPISTVAGAAARFTGGIGKAVISAPFKAVGAVGRGFQSKHIRKGDASDISASERLSFRDEHKARGVLSNIPLLGNSIFGSLGFNPTGYRDKYRGVDETLASMNDPEQLKEAMNAVESLTKGKSFYKKENRKTGRGLMAELSAVFPSSVCGRIKKALDRNKLDVVTNLINSSDPLKGVTLTQGQRDALIKKAGEALTVIDENTRKSNLSKEERSGLYDNLRNMGFSNIGDGNIDKIYKLVKSEYSFKKNTPPIGISDEEKDAEKNAKKVSDPIVDSAKENADNIIKALTESLKRIEEIQLAALPPSKRKTNLVKDMARQDKIVADRIKAEEEAKKAEEDTKNPKAEDTDSSTEINESDAEEVESEDDTHSKDPKLKKKKGVRWIFDSVAKKLRKFVKTSDGYDEASGKNKTDADKSEQEKETRQSRNFATGIALSLLSIFAPNHIDKTTGEEKKNPIVSLLKKAAKLAGIGAIGLTGIAATGHAAEFMATKGLPFIKGLWDERLKPFLLEHLGKVGEFIVDLPGKIWDKVVTAKDWILGQGASAGKGFPLLFTEKIFPFYEQGFQRFGERILTPLFGWLTKNSGTIISGILKGVVVPMAKGIWIGIKDIFTKKDDAVYNDPTGDDHKVALDPLPVLDITNPKPVVDSTFTVTPVTFDGKYAGATKEQAERAPLLQEAYEKAKSPAEKARIRQEMDKNADISQSGKVITDSTGMEHEAIKNSNMMTKDPIGNTVHADGSVASDAQMTTLNIHDGINSPLDRIYNYAGRRALGVKGNPFAAKVAGGVMKVGGKVTKKLSPLLALAPGGFVPSVLARGAGKMTELAGRGVQKFGDVISSPSMLSVGRLPGKLGLAGQKLQTATLGSAAGDLGEFLASKAKPGGFISNLGEKLSGSKFASIGADAQANKLEKLLSQPGIIESIKGVPGKLVDGAKNSKAGKLISKASGAIKNVVNKAGAGVAEDVLESGAKSAKGAVAEGVEGVGKGLLSKVKDFVTKNVKKFFESNTIINYVADAMASYGKKSSKKAVKGVLKEAGESLIKKIFAKIGQKLLKAGASLVAKITSIIASAGLMTVAFAIVDFIDGATHAENMFGFVKKTKTQDGIEVGFFERVIAGLVKVANGIFTLGLMPEDDIVNIFVFVMGEVFEMDTSEFKAKQEKSKQIIAEHNATTGDNYEDVSSFNAKDNWYNKTLMPKVNEIKTGAAKLGSDIWDKTKQYGTIIANSFGFGSKNESKYGTGRFHQNDPSISWMPFNKAGDTVRQTIGDSGCAPIAAANAVNYAYGTGADPISASKLAVGYKEKNGGTNPKFFKEYFGRNGLDSNTLHGQDAIMNNIKGGNPVILMGKDRYAGDNSPYGPNPHYIVGKGVDKYGNIVIDDPESAIGSRSFPASKVIGKSSVAVSASRYGRGKYGTGLGDYTLKTIYWPDGSVRPLDEPLSISKRDIYKSPDDVDEPCVEVGVYQGLFGSSKIGAHSSRYMKVSTLARIGHPMKQHHAAPAPTTSVNTNTTTNSPTGRLTLAEKNRAAFATLGWWDKPYTAMILKGNGAESAIMNEMCKKYSITITPQDMNKTVGTIIKSYFGCSPSNIRSFAKEVGPYVDLSLKDLKSQNVAVYGRLNSYSTVNGSPLNTYDQDNTTVGAVCGSFGLIFNSDNTPAASYSSEPTVPINTTDMNTTISNSQAQDTTDSPNIFDAISKFFVGLFDYTDKNTGETKNLLNIFGIGPGSSSSSSSSSSGTNGQAQATGVNGAMANGFPYFDQADPAWKDKPYGSGTMASSSCGPTSMAMILKSYGIDMDPVKAAEFSVKNGFRTANSGTSWGFFDKIGNNYGISTAQSETSADNIVNNLRKGYPIITSMKKGDFTNGGHFIVLSGLDNNGNVLVNDPSGIKGKERSARPWEASNIASQSKQMWIFNKDGMGSIGKIYSGASGGTTNAAGGTAEQNKKTIWEFLIRKGYTPIAAAGIMGNIQQECQFNHALVEGGGRADDPKRGIGICQWTWHTRKNNFLAAVPDWQTNLGGQLDFMWTEINQSYRGVLPAGMNKCKTVNEAVWLFHDIYEGSSDVDRTGGLANREKFGNGVYMQFASSAPINYGLGNKYGMAKELGITRNGEITSGFNDPTRASHKGIDIAGKAGQSIISPARGTIIRSEYNKTNGNMVVIQSEDGYLYTFCHLNSRSVNIGDRVSVGSLLGNMGNTGDSFGNHVHYQVTNAEGQFVDPLSVANGKKGLSGPQTANQPQRAIGGSDGLDYTQLIKIIVELLGTISDNTSKFAKALNIISEKTGADLSGVNLSSKDKGMSQIKDRLRALDSSNSSSSDLGSSMMGTNTDYIVKAMTAIAQS